MRITFSKLKKERTIKKGKIPRLERESSIQNVSQYENFIDNLGSLPLPKMANWDETTLFDKHKHSFYIKQIFDDINMMGENVVYMLKMSFHKGNKRNRVHGKIFKLKSGHYKPQKKDGKYTRNWYRRNNYKFEMVAELKYITSFFKFDEESEKFFLELNLRKECVGMEDFNYLVQKNIVHRLIIVRLLDNNMKVKI